MRGSVLLAIVVAPALIAAAAVTASAQTDNEVRAAVRRGVEYLKSTQNADGTWSGGYGRRLGGFALAGLALREGGVTVDDPAVSRVAEAVRQRAPNDSNTYDIALSIMFLDKLTRAEGSSQLRAARGKPNLASKKLKSGRTLIGQQVDDSNLIAELCRKLQTGQGPRGTWTYFCLTPSDGDHSNTQFGVLGLWVGGQHGVDVADNLRRCGEHFRGCQSQQGGWSYTQSGGDRPSMTAAGLIALATTAGMKAQLRAVTNPKEARAQGQPLADPNIQAGIKRLESYLTPNEANAPAPGGGLLGGIVPDFRMIAGMGSAQDLYFLWSLERVGVLYGLKTVGKVDWYQWGCRSLLPSQKQDGRWTGAYGPEIDTSFALLFLTRSNVSPELTEALTGRSASGGSEMRSFLPGADPKEALGLKASVTELLEALGAASDEEQRRELREELAARRPTYSAVKDDLGEICRLASSGDADVAAAARMQVINAFQRAPMSHCLYWLGQLDRDLGKLIWQQVDARIARADAARRREYFETGITVLGHESFNTASRLAAIELLRRLKDPQTAEKVIEGLIELPRELWPRAGSLLGELTGQNFGPREGDGIADVVEATRQWQAWLKTEDR